MNQPTPKTILTMGGPRYVKGNVLRARDFGKQFAIIFHTAVEFQISDRNSDADKKSSGRTNRAEIADTFFQAKCSQYFALV